MNLKTYTLWAIRLVCLYSLAWASMGMAADSYNPANNQLSIPSVQVGSTTYNNVVITVGQILSVGSSSNKNTYVRIQTNVGSMDFQLFPVNAPLTVQNFINYANTGFFTGTTFHRVIPNFVIQGGGFTPGLVQKLPTYAPIPLESPNGLSNTQYTIAMARTTDPNSATSQFYINLVNNAASLDYINALNPGYTVFGISTNNFGLASQTTATINTIASTPTQTINGFANVPVTDVVIQSVTVLSN
jgi:peptidyl-prolyl cis-trans isomerase A (cyclophilin A)